MKLSKSAEIALRMLASDELFVIATLRSKNNGIETDDWRADVWKNDRYFAVPINTFRKMRRDGLVQKRREWEVTNSLIHSEYELTDAGRTAVKE